MKITKLPERGDKPDPIHILYWDTELIATVLQNYRENTHAKLKFKLSMHYKLTIYCVKYTDTINKCALDIHLV